jgi:hypothetical protein
VIVPALEKRLGECKPSVLGIKLRFLGHSACGLLTILPELFYEIKTEIVNII